VLANGSGKYPCLSLKMSPAVGTNATVEITRLRHAPLAAPDKLYISCLSFGRGRDVRTWPIAVEKVCGMPSVRNNRIMVADFLNRSCAFDARFESILLAAPA